MLKTGTKTISKLTADAFLKTNGKLLPQAALAKLEAPGVLDVLQSNLSYLQEKLSITPPFLVRMTKQVPESFFEDKSGHSFVAASEMLGRVYKLTPEEQRSVVSKYPQIVNHPESFYPAQIQDLKDKLGWSPEQSLYLLKHAPGVFFQTPNSLFQVNQLFANLFERPLDEVGKFLYNNPYIYLGRLDWIKKNNFLLFKAGLTINQIYKVVQENPTFLLRNPNNLDLVLARLEKLGLKRPEIGQMFARNPLLASLSFPNGLIRQMNLWGDFGFAEKDVGRIFSMYPFLLTKNPRNTKDKLVYLARYFSIDVHKSPIGAKLLNYSLYEFLMPRGDVMLKNNVKEWGSVLDLSDEAFCKKFGCTKEDIKPRPNPGADKKGVRAKEALVPNIPELGLLSSELRSKVQHSHKFW